MAIQKQGFNIPFGQGLDSKTDEWQLPAGKMLRLENTVFNKNLILEKRNGFQEITGLSAEVSTLTTFNGSLAAIGSSVNSYNDNLKVWTDKGHLHPVTLKTEQLIRDNVGQAWQDTAVADSGLACIVYRDNNGNRYYKVVDKNTGQEYLPATQLTAAIDGPRVYLLGNYFAIIYAATGNLLEMLAINATVPSAPSSPITLSTQHSSPGTTCYEAVAANNSLYVAFRTTVSGGALRVIRVDSNLQPHTPITLFGQDARRLTISADTTTVTPTIYLVWVQNDGVTSSVATFDLNLVPILAPTVSGTAPSTVLNLGSVAYNNSTTVVAELGQTLSYDPSIQSNWVATTVITSAGVGVSGALVDLAAGLYSKPFLVNGVPYVVVQYVSPNQATYFLINLQGEVVAKLAYSNASGQYSNDGLVNVTAKNGTAEFGYLFKATITSVNKVGIFSTNGTNLASIDFNDTNTSVAEIGENLHVTGGQLWAFDGNVATEQGFHLYPDYVEATASTTGGLITANTYGYQAIYEWEDARGNIHRSAPSIPIFVTTTGSTSSVTVHVPCLHFTYKSNARIIIYRWSNAQQSYYQITSILNPLNNDLFGDNVSFVDTQPDSAIIGNALIYTTGGVIEDVAPPAASSLTINKGRLFLVDAEDRNLIWYSKQVIQDTPVEFSDLQTIYIPPTAGSQSDTGGITALCAMDDKLVIFKSNVIYYLVGSGPDILGNNNDFSEPVFITSTVGCTNQNSIVFTPQGIMFQSAKGIWLLGRDLSTTYIGAPVNAYKDIQVVSAVNVPGINQVRFALATGLVLVYDYFAGQWGTFTNIGHVSGTIYQGLHTIITSYGKVMQETPGKYLDGSRPVTIAFTTAWLNLAGVQGFERAYFFYLLGRYKTPHKLQITVAYDYNDAKTQTTLISPDNFVGNYGSDPAYGQSEVFGGGSQVEQWRIFLQTQKCQAISITVEETFDPSFGTIAGEGLTLSGINMILGQKGQYPRLKTGKAVG